MAALFGVDERAYGSKLIVDQIVPASAAPGESLQNVIAPLVRFLEAAGVDTGVASSPPPRGESRDRIVHFHSLWQPRFSLASARLRRAGIPYVVSPHGMLEPWAWRHKRWKKWPWFQLVERQHLRGAARLHATSRTEAEALGRFVPNERIVTIPLGLTSEIGPDYERARKALGWSGEETVLLFLSRIHEKKGLHLLLEALGDLPGAARERLRLVIVGEGEADYVARLRRVAAERRDHLPRIEWNGAVWGAEKWPYLQGADLLCLPTYSENFGLVVLEALQVGTPVLTTTGTPWKHEKLDGLFIVEPEVTSIESGLRTFFGDVNEWSVDQRIAQGAEVRQRYSWEAVGPQYLEMYESVWRNRK